MDMSSINNGNIVKVCPREQREISDGTYIRLKSELSNNEVALYPLVYTDASVLLLKEQNNSCMTIYQYNFICVYKGR